MQGYILQTKPVRDEDLLVWILTPARLVCCYRFYGARHGAISQGFKLDFELEQRAGFLPHLKGTMHLGLAWLHDRERLLAWQSFLRVLWTHLKDSDECEEVYFLLLEDCAKRLERQNPKRALLEAYLQLLAFEGRLSREAQCFLCARNVAENELCVARGFLLAHKTCLGKNSFEKERVLNAFKQKSCINLSDDEVAKLYYIMLEGL